jgi:short-subunit dehydrogenase
MTAVTRTALITGASAGLGKEFARQLAAKGYNLVLVSRTQADLEATAAPLRQEFGLDVYTIPADLAEAATPRLLQQDLQEKGIQIDFLVNNAGIAGPDLLEDRDWALQAAFFQLMTLSIAELCHLFIPDMRERGFGRVINVASVAGRLPSSGACNYGPSKAWVIALSEELALTVAADGVNVCALCPGFTHTEFHQRAGLMEMKNSLPGWLWYSAETVVGEGLAAVERGKRVYVSGRLYRWLDPLFQSVFTRRFFTRPARR